MAAEDPRTGDAEAATAKVEPDDNAEPPPPQVDVQALSKRLGRYQLVMPLAQGGMGLVFAGRLIGAHGVERLVAIKTLRPITSKSDREALLREARLTSRLHHRNIVATLDLGEVDDVPYVVMELVDGVSFSRLLSTVAAKKDKDKDQEPITVELATWIVMQAAHGLHAAHELTDAEERPLGLVHRDVSPQNILLSMSGEVKIADFGIAKFAGREESTATGMIKGKFGYMSPEQASAAEIDRRSDVFALGIVLWEALVREKLFSTDTPHRTILRVLEHVPKKPVDLRPEIGEEISSIVMRCLEKDPDKRFATAAAVADELRSALRSRKAAVDEGDLSMLVKRHFGDERRATMERLKNAPIGADGGKTDTLAGLLAAPPDGSAVVAVSLSTPRPKRTTRSRRVMVVVFAIVTAIAGVIVWRMNSPPTNTTTNAATTTPTTSTPTASEPPSLVKKAADEPTSSTTATPSSPPSQTTAPSAIVVRPKPQVPIPPKPSTAATPPKPSAPPTVSAAAPTPTKSSTTTTGKPFESL